MRPRQTSAGNAQFSNMLKVGQELGCQIQPSAANPSILAGLCPFHESKNLHEAKTLSISLENARFWCITCHAAGNPMAFLAKVWGISSQETYEFIQAGYAISAERPKWESQPQSKDQTGAPQAQNTAILTMATKYYKRQMEQSFTALNYLARLGVTPEQAAEKGFGYCSGDGLQEYLEKSGATPEELEASSLFQDVTGMEYLSGCPVLSDLDWTGATIWMLAIIPEDANNENYWPIHRPKIRGLPGRRNRLFNLGKMSTRSASVTVTDDPRLHLALEANGFTSALVTQYRTPGNAKTLTERITSTMAGRSPNRIIMAMHDRELGDRISQIITKEKPETVPLHRGIEEIMRQINPWERDLRTFTGGNIETNNRDLSQEVNQSATNGEAKPEEGQQKANQSATNEEAKPEEGQQKANQSATNGEAKPEEGQQKANQSATNGEAKPMGRKEGQQKADQLAPNGEAKPIGREEENQLIPEGETAGGSHHPGDSEIQET